MSMDTCNSTDVYVVPTVVGHCLPLQQENIVLLDHQSVSRICWESLSCHKLKWTTFCHQGELSTIRLVFRKTLFLNLTVNVW
jgi:hypothetical protein